MSRTPRRKSASNIYHITIRGNEHQDIFREKEDFNKFLSILDRSRKQYDFSLYAWCLMPNHVHLLLKEGKDPLSKIMQGISAAYVFWFNAKYDRSGHLFQGRYESVPVETRDYFLKAARYIHLNPVKGGICDFPEEYPFSSYSGIFKSGKYKDDDLIWGMIRNDEFEVFHQEKCDEIEFDEREKTRLSDSEIRDMIKKIIGSDEKSAVVSLPREKKSELIGDLLESGASLRQINRATGISINVIRAIGKRIKETD